MRVDEPPRVTVAIPLYRSARFLETIEANLSNLAGLEAPVEVLISDRHLHDDAIDRLEARHGHKPGFRFLRSNDAIGWVGHFNTLLREARGAYFMWMPHDDLFPPDYLPRLLAPLERDPSLIAAFGRIRSIGPRGYPRPEIAHPPPPIGRDEPWSTRLALRLATQWNPGIAFRGLFRREPLLRAGLLMRATRRSIDADRFWVSATGFLGPWRYVPECCCSKRYHSRNTHGQWKLTPGVWARAFPVLAGYGLDFAPRRRDRALAVVTFFCWTTEKWMESLAAGTTRTAHPARALSWILRKVTTSLVGGNGSASRSADGAGSGRMPQREYPAGG